MFPASFGEAGSTLIRLLFRISSNGIALTVREYGEVMSFVSNLVQISLSFPTYKKIDHHIILQRI